MDRHYMTSSRILLIAAITITLSTPSISSGTPLPISNSSSSESLPSSTLSNNQCHFTCKTCTGPLDTDCTTCAHPSRGYNGNPGYQHTCYCLGDKIESYESACQDTSFSADSLNLVASIELWIIGSLSILVAAFGNQFLGFYAIESVQLIGFSSFLNAEFPSIMKAVITPSEWFSFLLIPSILETTYTTPFSLNPNLTVDYTIVPAQELFPPAKFTYESISANFIYNSITTFTIAAFYFLVLLSLLVAHVLLKPHVHSFLGRIFANRSTLVLRAFIFTSGQLILYTILQFRVVDFSSTINAFGCIAAIIVFASHAIAIAYVFYIVNITRIKFEAPENSVYFNKLLKNDKPNRNFLLFQVVFKILFVIIIGTSLSDFKTQTILLLIATIAGSAITLKYIKLKKRRYQVFLHSVNLSRVIIFFLFMIFAFVSENNSKLTTAWVFSIVYLVHITILLIYLVIELSSQIPDIVYFIRTFSLSSCLKQPQNYREYDQSGNNNNPAGFRGSQTLDMELERLDYQAIVKSNPNPVFEGFNNSEDYTQIIQSHLDSYTFELPEEEEDDEDDENLPAHQTNKGNVSPRRKHQEFLQNLAQQDSEESDGDFDPENYESYSD